MLHLNPQVVFDPQKEDMNHLPLLGNNVGIYVVCCPSTYKLLEDRC